MDAARLPNFFIIGAAKAGTTSLYESLRMHPEVYAGQVKEPHFFSNDLQYEKGVEYYVNTYYKSADKYKARGDATPHYLFYEKAARRLSHLLPESHQRFIVILRNPIDRAYSLYWNMVHEGYENLAFEQALEAEPRRDLNDEDTRYGRVHFQYVASGMYAKQLRAYFEYFSKDKFLILFHEDLVEKHDETLLSVFRFLNIEESVDLGPAVRANPAGKPKSRELQAWLRHPSVVKRLLGKFLPFGAKQRLVSMLLDWNKRPFIILP